VNLIPSKFYNFNNNENINGKFDYNKKGKAPKQQIKEASKKAKRDKFNADSNDENVANENIHSSEDEESVEIQPMQVSNAVQLKQKLQSRIEELRAARGATRNGKSRKEMVEKRKQKIKKRKMTNDTLVINILNQGMKIQTEEIKKKDDEPMLLFGKIDFGQVPKKKRGPTDPAALLKIVI
jgi:hypothetical protein